ncbi:hypothetical protein VTK56DRAFT_7307 [Thermocarpiscus australiensis]
MTVLCLRSSNLQHRSRESRMQQKARGDFAPVLSEHITRYVRGCWWRLGSPRTTNRRANKQSGCFTEL